MSRHSIVSFTTDGLPRTLRNASAKIPPAHVEALKEHLLREHWAHGVRHTVTIEETGRGVVVTTFHGGGGVFAPFALRSTTARTAENGLKVHANGSIERPPGAHAFGLLRIFVSQRNLERVFGQAVADMREECIEAIAARKPWRYRGAWFRGHLSIAFTVFAFLTASVIKRFVEIWKAV